MLLLLGYTLLVFATLSYQSDAQARGIEEILGSGDDVSIENDSVGQKLLQPGIPRSAGSFPMTASDLINLTTRTYLDPLPASPDISQVLQNVSGELWLSRNIRNGDLNQINMMVPRVLGCKPVIRGTKRLYSGIACGSEPCSIQTSFTVNENYESAEGYRVETTVSAGLEIKGISVSASTTRGRSWEKTWGRGSTTGVTYTWNLPANGHCTPSMAHVELECDAHFNPVYYDTYWIRRSDTLLLEYQYNRKGGPPINYNGQWCHEWYVQPTPLNRQQDWFPILAENRYRGLMWKLPSDEMNRHHLYDHFRPILPSDVVIGKVRGHGGNWHEIYVCTPDFRNGVTHKVTAPLSSEAGALEGYIGCVTGPSRGENTGTDASSGEL